MPVEFHCSVCQKLLCVPDEHAGGKARCPSCYAIVLVPSTPPASEPDVGSPAGPPSAAPPPENPFADIAVDRGVGSRQAPAQNHGPSNPYASPAAVGMKPSGVSTPETQLRHSRFALDQVLRCTWGIFTDQLGLCIVVSLILIGIVLVGYGAILGAIFGVIAAAVESQEPTRVAMMVPVLLVLCFGALFAYAWLQLGQAILMIKIARGERADINDLFSGGPYLMKGVGLTLVLALINVGVSLLYMIPAMAVGKEGFTLVMQWAGNIVNYIISLLVFLSVYFIVDRNVGVFESINSSFRYMRGNKLTLFLVHLVFGAISLVLMLLTCLIGAIVVIPFWMVLGAVVYLLATGQPTAEARRVALKKNRSRRDDAEVISVLDM